MRLFHAPAKTLATFDDEHLIGFAGLAPVMRLAERCGLRELATEYVTAADPHSANTPEKISSIVAGMVAGADSIDDLDALRHGGMDTVFDGIRAPSTLFTDSPHTLVQAEEQHRDHAVVEQANADLIEGPLAHLPSGVFTANAGWLTLAALAHNLLRAAGCLASAFHSRARGATLRRHLVNVPARIARHGRGHLTCHLPAHWRWQHAWMNLFDAMFRPPPARAG